MFLALCLIVNVRYNHEKNELLECSLSVSQASLPRKKFSIRPSELLLAFFFFKTGVNAKSKIKIISSVLNILIQFKLIFI